MKFMRLGEMNHDRASQNFLWVDATSVCLHEMSTLSSFTMLVSVTSGCQQKLTAGRRSGFGSFLDGLETLKISVRSAHQNQTGLGKNGWFVHAHDQPWKKTEKLGMQGGDTKHRVNGQKLILLKGFRNLLKEITSGTRSQWRQVQHPGHALTSHFLRMGLKRK